MHIARVGILFCLIPTLLPLMGLASVPMAQSCEGAFASKPGGKPASAPQTLEELAQFRVDIDTRNSEFRDRLNELWLSKYRILTPDEQATVIEKVKLLQRQFIEESTRNEDIRQRQQAKISSLILSLHPNLDQRKLLNTDATARLDAGPWRSFIADTPNNSGVQIQPGVIWGQSGEFALVRTQLRGETMIVNLRSQTSKQLPPNTRLSHDGSWAYYPSGKGQFHLVDLKTSKVYPVEGDFTWKNTLYDNLYFASRTEGAKFYWQVTQPKTGRQLITDEPSISRSRKRIAYLDEQQQFRVFDVQSWQEIATPLSGQLLKTIYRANSVIEGYFYFLNEGRPAAFDLETLQVLYVDSPHAESLAPVERTSLFFGDVSNNGTMAAEKEYVWALPQGKGHLEVNGLIIYKEQIDSMVVNAIGLGNGKTGVVTWKAGDDKLSKDEFVGNVQSLDSSGLVFYETDGNVHAYDPVTQLHYENLRIDPKQIAGMSKDRSSVYWLKIDWSRIDSSPSFRKLMATNLKSGATVELPMQYASVRPDHQFAIIHKENGDFELLSETKSTDQK